jgi:hypothetical protein
LAFRGGTFFLWGFSLLQYPTLAQWADLLSWSVCASSVLGNTNLEKDFWGTPERHISHAQSLAENRRIDFGIFALYRIAAFRLPLV